MTKVKTTTGDILEVTPNEAHELIESGRAKLYRGKKDPRRPTPPKTVPPKTAGSFYDHRQMKAGTKGKGAIRTKRFPRGK